LKNENIPHIEKGRRKHMKKLLVALTLVGTMTFSLPVMASSPTAQSTLTTSTSTTTTTTTTAPAQTVSDAAIPASLSGETRAAATNIANNLLKSGAVATPAAAIAVGTSLAQIQTAPALTVESKQAAATAAYNAMTAEQKAFIQQAAATRNISAEEAVGNYIKPDTTIAGSVAVAWDANLSVNSVDGKAGNVNVILCKPAADVITSGLSQLSGKNVLNAVQLVLQNGVAFKTFDTAISVQGVTAADAGKIEVYQMVNGKLVKVKVTAVVNGAIGLHLTGNGPIFIVRK
jgi:hypothetical protein